MLDLLKEADQQLFLWLNQFHHEIFDCFFFWFTQKYSSVPLYAVLMFLLWKQEKKRIVIWLPIIALLITTSDQFASGLCKPLFQRLRPCHEPSMFGLVHTVNGVCGGKFGFVSSHSANAFALAFFLARLFEVSIPKLRFWITLWASLQAYSRVYLGVHYPADVLVPIVFSFGFAWFWFTVGKKIIQQYCLT